MNFFLVKVFLPDYQLNEIGNILLSITMVNSMILYLLLMVSINGSVHVAFEAQLESPVQKFRTDILAGCETQADWRQATDEQQFRNIIGVGMDTRSVVAHNINERMQRNQHGGCAMMAMGRFSAEVGETGVNHYSLGRWCWMRVGSGDKKTRIVMAYQPSGSSNPNSAGTTV
jgi:hypothetical protein